MVKRLVSNVYVMHYGAGEHAVEKTQWSTGDWLRDSVKTGKLKRGDWCSILVLELEPGWGTTVADVHADEASAYAEVGDNLKWIDDSRYVGIALAHIE